MNIQTTLQQQLIAEEVPHEKKTYWASESDKMLFDIYHEWMGTEPTNPLEIETKMIFNAGKMMELAIVELLQRAGMALEITGEEQLRMEMEREGVPISGYVDAILSDGTPLEIKSYYGAHQTRDIANGKARESYLKQLAMYMDYLNKDIGKLLYIERGTGEMFEFDLIREGNVFTCNDVTFDITDTYKRWSKFYKENILPKKEPAPDYLYKIPVDKVDWKKISPSDITKARTNKKVIGEHPWAVQYSRYKNLIIERQGVEAGYTSSELEQIKALTSGFTSWNKKPKT